MNLVPSGVLDLTKALTATIKSLRQCSNPPENAVTAAKVGQTPKQQQGSASFCPFGAFYILYYIIYKQPPFCLDDDLVIKQVSSN